MKNKIILGIVVLLLAGGLTYYVWNDLHKTNRNNNTSHSASIFSGNNGAVSVGDATAEGTGDFTVKIDQATTTSVTNNTKAALPKIPLPNLDREVVMPGRFSAEEQKIFLDKINASISVLKKHHGSFADWINLGLRRKMIDDYEGARQAWEYASALSPINSLSFGNLGVLYGYYLKDNVQAEKNFLKSIENDPRQSALYFQTFEFYRDVIKDNMKAVAIMQKAIKNIPAEKANLQKVIDSLGK